MSLSRREAMQAAAVLAVPVPSVGLPMSPSTGIWCCPVHTCRVVTLGSYAGGTFMLEPGDVVMFRTREFMRFVFAVNRRLSPYGMTGEVAEVYLSDRDIVELAAEAREHYK